MKITEAINSYDQVFRIGDKVKSKKDGEVFEIVGFYWFRGCICIMRICPLTGNKIRTSSIDSYVM